jgi:hypothetical protein
LRIGGHKPAGIIRLHDTTFGVITEHVAVFDGGYIRIPCTLRVAARIDKAKEPIAPRLAVLRWGSRLGDATVLLFELTQALQVHGAGLAYTVINPGRLWLRECGWISHTINSFADRSAALISLHNTAFGEACGALLRAFWAHCLRHLVTHSLRQAGGGHDFLSDSGVIHGLRSSLRLAHAGTSVEFSEHEILGRHTGAALLHNLLELLVGEVFEASLDLDNVHGLSS